MEIERFINKKTLSNSSHIPKLISQPKMLNKKAKAILSVILLSFLIVSLFAVSVSAGLFDDLFGKEKAETSTIWKTTAQGPIIKNNDGTYTKTLGSQTYRDDKTRRFPNYVPFEDTINVTEENGKLKITDLVEDEEYYIELEYEKKNSMSISQNKFEINKSRGYWYFTSDSQTEVNSMEYKINSEKDITFKDEKLILNNEVAIDFKQARTEQNITTTYDSKTKKLIFEMEKDEFGKKKGGSLSMIDPTITLDSTDDVADISAYYTDLGGTDFSIVSVGQMRWNISSISNSWKIINASLNVRYEYDQTPMDTINITRILNQTWNESISITEFKALQIGDSSINSITGSKIFWSWNTIDILDVINSDISESNQFSSFRLSTTNNAPLISELTTTEDSTDLYIINSSGNGIKFDSAETSYQPYLNITYTPYIDIITPTPAQIFTEDAPTTYFNVSTSENMDTCYWSPDTGVTNYTMTSVNSTFFTLANTSMVDGAHTIEFYCNQTDGTWRTSDTVSFDVDSVNITVCRDLTVSREYELQNDIYDAGTCINILNDDIIFDGNNNELSSDYSFSFDYGIKVVGYNNININNTKFYNCSIGISFNTVTNPIISNSIFNKSKVYHIYGPQKVSSGIFNNISLYGDGEGFHFSTTLSNNIFRNILYDGEDSAIVFDSGTNNTIFYDSNFTTSGSEIIEILSGYNNTFINCSYTLSKENVISGNLTRKWYFQTQVNDSSGYLENAQVDIYDKDSNLISSELTDATGQIGREEITEYVNTGGTKAYETPHTIEISKADYITNSTIYNLTSETNVYHSVTLEISETAPVSTLSSPIDWYNSSSLTNTLVCNSSDTDGNLKNVTIQTWLSGVEESTQTTSITGLTNSTSYTSFGFVGQSTYEWNCYVCDDADNCVWGTNRTIYIDVDAPSVSQTTPTNNTNTTTSSQNLTASITDNRGIANATLHIFNSSDDEINTTTIKFGTGVVSTTVGVVYDFVDGLFKWIWEVFDWSGNSDSDSNYTIGIDDTKTVVNIVYPLNDTYYNFANFTINSTQTDNYAGIDSCWYTNDSLTNYTFTCGQNISANLSEGTFTYVIYSNDTFGNIGSDSVTFYISLGPPAINLNYPLVNQYLDNGTDVYFNFTATDSDGLDTCELWGNWTGTYSVNYTWVGPESAVMNWTTQNISEGQYIFAVWCNDTLGTERITDNRTFEIDLTYPDVIHSHYVPTTVYNDDSVTIYGNITDTNLDSVWIEINSSGNYNNVTVTTHTGDMYIYALTDVEIDNFENISWYWYVNDSVGNVNNSLLESFIVSNRNPYNVTIDNPSNNSYVNINSLIINFSSTDADLDTINYTLYNSTDGITFSLYNSTTNTWFNFSGFDTSEGATNYYYITANDTELQNNSNTDMFTIDVTNPNLIVDYPQASPTVQCSMTNIELNYSVNDTNLDYCTLNVTSGGVISTAHTTLSDCSNATFNVSFDNTVQLFNFNVVDKAGNSNSTTRLIYVDTDNAGCPTEGGTTTGSGGGTPVVEGEIVTYCGDDVCQDGLNNRTDRGETFYNCPEDCSVSFNFENFNLDTLLLNCYYGIFEDDKEKLGECIWVTNPALLFIFGFIAFILIFTIFFQFVPKSKGIKKWVVKQKWKRKKRY